MRPADAERIKSEVSERVLARYAADPMAAEDVLLDAIFEERRRLEAEPDTRLAAQQTAFYDRLYREARLAGRGPQPDLLRQLVRAFVEEVTGHFDERVYELATRVLPPALNVLLNTFSPLRLLAALRTGFATLEQQLEISGEVEALQQLAGHGTTILVPTHVSNLDSIVVGFGLFRLGLPPYVYGAGLNLFHNRLIAFFMNNLGAYKVDRRKKARLYKEVLKTYAGCSLELGYHNLFFPGGTRSRSGAVERKLKLGLLGMGLDAYVHNLRAGRSRPDVFIIPCTVNYQLVLEAETLIDDHLKEVGKSRYIIEDDEFSQVQRIADFLQRLLNLHSRIQIVISQPLDPFGNPVDAAGRSCDARGRYVERKCYVQVAGEPNCDPQRDSEYTRELAQSIVQCFGRDTVLSSTHLLAHVVFSLLRRRSPGLDMCRLLRTAGEQESLSLAVVYELLERELEAVRRAADARHVRLDETLLRRDPVFVVNEALAHLASYHRRPAMRRQGDRLWPVDGNLLLYYQNRLAHLSLAELRGPT